MSGVLKNAAVWLLMLDPRYISGVLTSMVSFRRSLNLDPKPQDLSRKVPNIDLPKLNMKINILNDNFLQLKYFRNNPLMHNITKKDIEFVDLSDIMDEKFDKPIDNNNIELVVMVTSSLRRLQPFLRKLLIKLLK